MADIFGAIEHWLEQRFAVRNASGVVKSVAGTTIMVSVEGNPQPQQCFVAEGLQPAAGDFCILHRPARSQNWVITSVYGDQSRGKSNQRKAIPQHLLGATYFGNTLRAYNSAVTVNSSSYTELVEDVIVTTGGSLLIDFTGWAAYTPGSGWAGLLISVFVDDTAEFSMDSAQGFQFHGTNYPSGRITLPLVIPDVRVGEHSVSIRGALTGTGSFSVTANALSISEI